MLFQLIQATKSGNVYNLHDFYTFNSAGKLTSSFKIDVTKQFEYNFSTKEYIGTPKIILRNDLFTPALNYRQHTHIICFDLRKIYEIVGYNYTSDFQTEMLLAEDFFISKYYELQSKKIFNKNTFDVNRFIGVHNVDEISNKYDTITERAVKQDTVGKWLLIFIQGDYTGNVTLNLNAPPLSALETFSSVSDLHLKYPEVITDNPNSYYYLNKVVAVSIGGTIFHVQCQYNGTRLEWDTITTTVSGLDGTTFSFATSAFSLNQYDTNVRCVAFPFSAGVRPNGDKLTPPAFMISGFGAGISEFILSVRIITDEILDINYIDHTSGGELTHDVYFNKYIVTRDSTTYNDILQVTDCTRTIDVSKIIDVWSPTWSGSFQDVGHFVLNGDETLTIEPLTNVVKVFYEFFNAGYPKSSGQVVINDTSFPFITNSGLDSKHYYIGSASLLLFIPKSELTTYDLVGVQEWLSNNNIVCFYQIQGITPNPTIANLTSWRPQGGVSYDDINLIPDGTSYYYPFKKHMLYLYGKEILVDANKLSHLFLDIIITVKGTAFSLYYKDKRNIIADGLMTSEIIWQADRLDMFYQNNPTYKDQFIVDGIAKGAIATGSVLLGAFSTVTNPGFIANGVGSAINLTSSIINYGLMEKGKRAEPDQRNGDSSNIDLAILKGYGIYWVTMTPDQEILDILKSQYSLVGFPTNVYKTINETTPFDVFNIWKKALLLNGEVKEIIENVQITREINTKLGQGVIVEYE